MFAVIIFCNFFLKKEFADLMFAVHFMNEHFYFNINLDIGNMVKVVKEYTLIMVKNVFFTLHHYAVHKNTKLFESIDDNFRLLR